MSAIPVDLIAEPDGPQPCRHCEDGESPAGHCTCCEPTGLVVVDRPTGTVSAEVWHRRQCTHRETLCAPGDSPTVDGLVAIARSELEMRGVRLVWVTDDLEAAA